MQSSRPKYHLDVQEFDSGRIAGRVGSVHLEDPLAVTSELGAEIAEEGARQGYDLLSLRTPCPIELDGFEPRGVVATLTGKLGDIVERLRGLVPPRLPVRTLREDDWPAVRGLLRWAGATRFSTDPRISGEVAREHKMAMLRAHAERCPKHALVAVAGRDSAEVVGLQVSYLEGGEIVLYEIVVDPAYRRRLAATALLSENVRRFDSVRTTGEVPAGDRRASTRIYTDNRASMKLFERIGLRRVEREEHYYHAWL